MTSFFAFNSSSSSSATTTITDDCSQQSSEIDTKITKTDKNQQKLYDLKSVIVHIGSPTVG